jgi:hypothetical protein
MVFRDVEGGLLTARRSRSPQLGACRPGEARPRLTSDTDVKHTTYPFEMGG